MSYSVRIKSSARREIARLPLRERQRVADEIDSLPERPLSGKPLRGGLRGLRSLRSGDYRIIYHLVQDQLVILVVRVAHRRESYRRR